MLMKTLIAATIFILLSGCGFKVVNLSDIENFNIISVNTEGEKRINYIIKNNLSKASKKNDVNEITINLKTKKNKEIKEKNIKNEITKYEIIIIVDVIVKKLVDNTTYNFTISSNGSYSVDSRNSTTRNNEKKLILLLSNKLADKILNETNIILNDI